LVNLETLRQRDALEQTVLELLMWLDGCGDHDLADSEAG
jgi:hypothetical protein